MGGLEVDVSYASNDIRVPWGEKHTNIDEPPNPNVYTRVAKDP